MTDRTPPDRTPVLMAALSVAMSARTNMLSQHAVDDMRTRAEELLERDDPMRSAVLTFATQWEAHHRDPHGLRYCGEELQRALDADLGLEPPRRERRDIDG